MFCADVCCVCPSENVSELDQTYLGMPLIEVLIGNSTSVGMFVHLPPWKVPAIKATSVRKPKCSLCFLRYLNLSKVSSCTSPILFRELVYTENFPAQVVSQKTDAREESGCNF